MKRNKIISLLISIIFVFNVSLPLIYAEIPDNSIIIGNSAYDQGCLFNPSFKDEIQDKLNSTDKNNVYYKYSTPTKKVFQKVYGNGNLTDEEIQQLPQINYKDIHGNSYKYAQGNGNIMTVSDDKDVKFLDTQTTETVQNQLVESVDNEVYGDFLGNNSTNTTSDDIVSSIPVKGLPDDLKDIKKDEILFLEPTQENPLGSTLKVDSFSKDSQGDQIVNFSVPNIDEVLSEISIDGDDEVTPDNVVSYDLPAGAKIINAQGSSYVPRASSTERSDSSDDIGLNSILKNFICKYGAFSKTKISTEHFFDNDSLKIGFENAVIYDKDNKLSTTNDQLKLTATLTLKDFKLYYKLNKSKNSFGIPKWNKFKFGLTGTTEFDGKLATSPGGSKLKFKYGVKQLKKQVNKKLAKHVLELGSQQSIDLGFMKLKGIKMSDRIVIGSLTLGAGPATLVTQQGGPPKSIPLGITLLLTLTPDFKLNVSASISAESDYNLNMGIDYDRERTDSRFKIVNSFDNTKNTWGFQCEGSGSASVALASELGISVMGMVPAEIVLPVSLEATAKGSINCSSDTGSNIKFEGTLGAYFKPKGVISIELDTEIPFAKKIGFDKTWNFLGKDGKKLFEITKKKKITSKKT